MSGTVLAGGGLETASQAKLTWLRFRRHRMAMVGLTIVALMYLVALFAEPVAPFNPDKSNARLVFHPPQTIQFFDGWSFSPHVLPFKLARDPVTLQPSYVADGTRKIALRFFVTGDPYKLWGLFDGNIHLIGPENPRETVFLLGDSDVTCTATDLAGNTASCTFLATATWHTTTSSSNASIRCRATETLCAASPSSF